MRERTPTVLNSSSQLRSLGMQRPDKSNIPSACTYNFLIRSWLDGRHVVFGEVLEGYEVVDKIQNIEKEPGDRPKDAVKIAKSGELPMTEEGTSHDEI